MNAKDASGHTSLRYQADEKPPATLSFGLGLQLAALSIAIVILIPTVVMRAADTTEAYLSWAVFASVAVVGVSTMLQAIRIGRIGAGFVLVMGPSEAFIAVCVMAIIEGGPAMLATLVVISSLIPFALSRRLSLFQRFLTPAIVGTVIMLIPITILPALLNLLSVPGSPPVAAPLSALVTLFIISGIALKATGVLRFWSPVIGVVIGSVIGSFFGLYEVDRIAAASWIGLPTNEWPGFSFDFGPTFLGASSCISVRRRNQLHPNDQQRHRHPTGIVAQEPCSGFPGGGRCGSRGWHKQSVFRSRGNDT